MTEARLPIAASDLAELAANLMLMQERAAKAVSLFERATGIKISDPSQEAPATAQQAAGE